MNKLCAFLFAATLAIAVSPVLAQQGQQEDPTDHNAHHGGPEQQDEQQAPNGGGMMGKGGQGQGMMGKGGQGMMGQGMMGKGMMGGMMGKGGGMEMHSRPMMEARLAYIKADLEITEAQTAAWNAYADAVRARHAAMTGMHDGMMKAKKDGSALERLDARIKATEAKLESLKSLKPVVADLYAVLTAPQKKKADKLLARGCPMMGG